MKWYVVERYYDSGNCRASVENSKTALPLRESLVHQDVYRVEYPSRKAALAALPAAIRALKDA